MRKVRRVRRLAAIGVVGVAVLGVVGLVVGWRRSVAVSVRTEASIRDGGPVVDPTDELGPVKGSLRRR